MNATEHARRARKPTITGGNPFEFPVPAHLSSAHAAALMSRISALVRGRRDRRFAGELTLGFHGDHRPDGARILQR
jgi:hypothetical protein